MPRRVGAVRAWRDPRGVSFLRLQQAADERAAVLAVQGKFQPQAEDLLDRSESGFISSRRGLFPIKIKLSPICFRSSRVQRRVAQLKIPVYGTPAGLRLPGAVWVRGKRAKRVLVPDDVRCTADYVSAALAAYHAL